IQIVDVSEAEYDKSDLDEIRNKLFKGSEKRGIIELVGEGVHIASLNPIDGVVTLNELKCGMLGKSCNQRALLLADTESISGPQGTIFDFTTDQLKQTTLTEVNTKIGASVKNVILSDDYNNNNLLVGSLATMVLNGSSTDESLVKKLGKTVGVNVHRGGVLVLGNLDSANQGTVGSLQVARGQNNSQGVGFSSTISMLGQSNEKRSSFTVDGLISADTGDTVGEEHQVLLINSDVNVTETAKIYTLSLQNSNLNIGKTLTLRGREGFASKIAGSVTASELTGDGTAYIGDKTSSGSVSVKKLSSTGLLFLDPLWTGNETWGDGSWLVASELAGDNSDELQTKLIVGMNSSVVLGTDKETALTEAKNLGLTYGEDQIESVVYIAKPIQVADTGMLYVDGSLTNVSDVQLSDNLIYEPGSVVLSGNTLSMYDVSSSNGTAMVTAKKLTVDSAARLGIINATVSSDPIVLFNVDELVKTDDQGNTDFDLSNIFVTSDLMLEIKPVWDEATKTLSFTTVKHESATTRFPGLWTDSFMDQLYKTSSNNTNSSDKSIALLSRTASFADYGFSSIEQAVQATNEMTALAVTSGVYNTAIDAGKLMNSSVEQRLSLTQTPDWSQGLNLWVDANGTTNQAKTLYGASGYELDLAGLVFGADTEVASSTRVGVAVTLGTGTGHSKNAVVRTKNSADFSGISLYGAKRIGAFNAQADLGYMHTKSDITRANAYGLNFDDDVKTNAITVGVRGEYQIPVGQFDVVPHVGLRWTHLRVGDYSAGFKTDSERLNVVTMPVGVGVRGSFNASSWSLSPNVDVTVNPALGSKKASSRVHCGNLTENIRTHVIDTAPVQMSLGLNAQNGAWTVGASWDLNVGSRDRLDNSIKLKARYVF
ncbi:MAG: autotransporter domain-containing protein, partial [Burkholderiaceae bacterium]|nr:autotransporter domain-containing protein [Burkholderiaceae bacterium]